MRTEKELIKAKLSEEYWVKKLRACEEHYLYSVKESIQEKYERTLEIPDGVHAMFSKIGAQKPLNIFKLYMATTAVILSRYSPGVSVIVATPSFSIDGLPAREGTLLFFRLDLDKDKTIKELLEEVHRELNECHKNMEYDLAAVSELLETQGDRVEPLYNIGFSYGPFSAERPLPAEMNLSISVSETNGKAEITVATNGFYSAAFVDQLIVHFIEAARNIIEKRAEKLHMIEVLSPVEQEKLIGLGKGQAFEYDPDRTVIHLFLEQARTHPGVTAIRYGSRDINYNDLAASASSIGGYLTSACSVKRGDIVAMLTDRSPEMVMAILGILMTGAACLPLDPSFPPDRLEMIVKDSGCKAVLVSDEYYSGEHKFLGNIVQFSVALKSPHTAELTSPGGSDAIYVMYSSGTTGKPKGIVVEHSSFTNLLLWYNQMYNITADTRIVQLTSIVIDIAFQEIFSSLINAATLFIPEHEVIFNKHQFLGYMKNCGINFIQVIPDTLQEYFADEEKLPDLDTLLCGGDKLSEKLLSTIKDKGYNLCNVYGQTETTIDTMVMHGKKKEKGFSVFVNNYAVYILNEGGLLQPPGVPGQICISGKGVARGYLNNEALTQQKFVDNPWHKGSKMYQTGDLGRWLPDGSIEFLGRNDFQVKIRGFRVELSEVESALYSYPAIREVIVVADKSASDSILVAYVVAGETLNPFNVKDTLRQVLPEYMIPSAIVQLEKFPLTANGKIDRKSLPSPVIASGVKAFASPENKVEKELVELWMEMLGGREIGIDDNFFDIGGNSLKVISLMGKIGKSYPGEITVADIYNHPTVRELAAIIGGKAEHINIDREFEEFEL